MTKREQHPTERLPTGVPGLDTVLNGGLTAGAVFIVQGSPGAGKTILSNQICFSHIAQGNRAIYVTLLAESHDRLINHLGGLSFFDSGKIPQSMYFISGFDILAREGLRGILQLLRAETRTRGASMMVLDGLFALEEAADSEGEFRKFVNDLSTLASMLDCTILLLTNSGRGRSSAEYTMVDGWLQLEFEEVDYRSYRFLRVHKFRGSPFLSGRHTFTISDSGVTILPRLESTPQAFRPPAARLGSLTTGLPDLDAMMGGGIPCGSTTLVVGPTGIGKTTLGLQFLSASTPEEPGLIFGLYESPDELRHKAAALGFDLEPLERSGAVEIVWHAATENLLDELGAQLLEAVRRKKPKRLFIDGIDAFRQSVIFPSRLSRFLTALTSILRDEGATTLFTSEIPELIGGEARMSFGSITAVAENVILMRYRELDSHLRRSISILKVRVSHFDERVRGFEIDQHGLRIGDPLPPVSRSEERVTLPMDRAPGE